MARPRLGRNSNIDIHELMKREAFDHADGTSFDANHFERQRPAPGGVVGVSDQYVVLDSFLKTQTSDTANGQFHWNMMIQGVTGDQVIGVHDRMDNIIEIQFGQILMPPLPPIPYMLGSADPFDPDIPRSISFGGITLTQNNNMSFGRLPMSYGVSTEFYDIKNSAYASSWAFDPQSQLALGIFTIEIVEAGLQSISDIAGARHHLDYSVAINNQRPLAYGFTSSLGKTTTDAIVTALPLESNPLGIGSSEWDTYQFTEPLSDINELTLRFRGPDAPLSFAPDCYYNIAFYADIPDPTSDYQTAHNVYFDCPSNYGLNVGDQVIIRNFKSGNSSLDRYMNSSNGLVVTDEPPLKKPPFNNHHNNIGTEIFLLKAYFDPCIDVEYLNLVPPSATEPVQINDGNATVCILKYRLRIPVRLRRVVQRLTNYKSP